MKARYWLATLALSLLASLGTATPVQAECVECDDFTVDGDWSHNCKERGTWGGPNYDCWRAGEGDCVGCGECDVHNEGCTVTMADSAWMELQFADWQDPRRIMDLVNGNLAPNFRLDPGKHVLELIGCEGEVLRRRDLDEDLVQVVMRAAESSKESHGFVIAGL